LSDPNKSNELINRRIISSAASAARRNLVERMLNNANESTLGIEGFPPEKSIYESVLRVTTIHQSSSPYWRLPAHNKDPLNMRPLYKYMEDVIFGAIEEPISVQNILHGLAIPPYGIMAGVFPILFVAFLQSHPDEISLYKDGVFIPDPSIADFEVLMRRPELYGVAGSRLTGERLEVVKRISKSLKVNQTTLSVARAIISMVRQLPDHAWRTKLLSEPAINLRTVIEQAKSPERLLFVDIPRALDEPSFMDGLSVDKERIESFFEKLNNAIKEWGNVTEYRIIEAGDILLEACNLPHGAQGWQELIEIAQQLERKPLDDLLKPFIKRLTVKNDLEVIIESVLALIVNRPPRSWTDQEVVSFPSLAEQIGDQFILATQQYKVLSPRDEIICNDLIEKIKLQISDSLSPHIKKAALARLLQEQD